MSKLIKNNIYIFSFLLLSIISFRVNAQSEIIGVIDFYGSNNISGKDIMNAINIKEGDSVSGINKNELIRKLRSISGVKQAYITTVCCEESMGRSILYVGVSNKDAMTDPYHPSPATHITLPKEIIDDYDKLNELMFEGITKGQSGEDRSQGHSLMNYIPARTIQEKFVGYASQYPALLKNVLKNSSDASQRAIAAQIIAYSKNKESIIDDLLYAVHDNDETVRNNSTRALALIASYTAGHPELKIKKIPVEPFIEMINSITWSDRNKGAAVLLSLTENRDSLTIKRLKEKALSSIIEMSKWKNAGHAMMAYVLLGRITGFTDEEIYNSFASDKKDSFLITMLNKVPVH
jgi:hypothetical protein